MNKNCKFFAFFLACVLGQFSAVCQEIHFTVVDPPKEQAWSGITGIVQDQQGYLWLATFNGLYKYDGKNYTLYRHEPSNPNSLGTDELEHVFADGDGMIWIATFGAGLDKLDPTTGIFTHFRHKANDPGSILDDKVSSIIKDRDGMMWIGTNSGLEKFDPKTGRFTHFTHNKHDPASLSNNQVRVIYEDKQGTIWVGTGSPQYFETPKNEGGLNKLDKKTGKFTRYMNNPTDKHSLIDNRVQVIFEDSRGTFWIGTAGDGLHTMDRKTGIIYRHPYDPKHPENLSRPPVKSDAGGWDDHVTFINEDNLGKIWIGTYENGLNIYDPSTQKVTWYGDGPKSKEKINANVWRAYKTREGIMWITSFSAAFYKINPYRQKIAHHYMGTDVVDFSEDAGGALWLATGKGLIREGPGGQKIFRTVEKSPGANQFDKIEKDSENKLWLGSDPGGLYRFDPETRAYKIYHHQKNNTNSLISDSVTFIKSGPAGKLWIGTEHGLDEMDTRTGKFEHFRNIAKETTSISSDYILAIAIDKNDNVWVGTRDGLNKLDNKTRHFKRYMIDEAVQSMAVDSRDNLWVGTFNEFYRYDKSNDTFYPLDIDGTSYYGIAEDLNKNLWINTQKGIIKLNTETNEVNVYGINQGINWRATEYFGYTRHTGDVLFGDTSGYFMFQPDKLLHSTPAATVVINAFLLNDVPVVSSVGGILTGPLYTTKEIRLSHTQATFSFGFSTIDYANEAGDNQSFYMLKGYDSKWRSATGEEAANYYNISPGEYSFKVKSINTNGLVSEKQIAVIISRPWWQNWWAYGAFVLASAGSIWGFVWYRSKALMRDKRVLERKVNARTQEVLQHKEEIAAQRDSLEEALNELKSTQTQLIQSEKMASLGELTAGIAHEIQNPLNFVNNFSDVNREMIGELKAELKGGNLDEALVIADDIEQNEQKINHHGKRADSIVKGMLEHSRSGRGQKEPTDLNVMADEYMRLAYHGFRAKDKSFNAELTTHFDAGLPKINVIPQDIGRVMLNLFNNAFYAVSQKQKTADKGYKPEVSVTTYTENGNVVIKVKDNGVGIPENIKDKIMQPFFTTKPTGEGTGLGLSLTYDMVVKGHGGIITVDSKEGEFTEFIVSLPLNQQK